VVVRVVPLPIRMPQVTFNTLVRQPARPGRVTIVLILDPGTIIALNSNCSNAGGCGSTSAQYKWLQADLSAHTNLCTLAYWHIPFIVPADAPMPIPSHSGNFSMPTMLTLSSTVMTIFMNGLRPRIQPVHWTWSRAFANSLSGPAALITHPLYPSLRIVNCATRLHLEYSS